MIPIKLDDTMVNKYAKKIFGFAFSKTKNTHQAEDLSQEILCALMDALARQDDIADLDGFVYTVANYTWCNFLRRNKRHWHHLDVENLHHVDAGHNVEADAVNTLLLEKMQAQIHYLTNLHRQITILFYYENKTSQDIAQLLDISHSTIRWHLTEIKKKLKAGIEMGEYKNYQPKRLWCGHDGLALDNSMCGLGRNPLVDNIALVCYGKFMTIEDMARTLQVAAFYIEPIVKDMAHLDYLRVKDKNKYITNFYIRTENFRVAQAKYMYHHIGPYAEKIIGVYRKYASQLQAIGFVGSDLDIDTLLWAFIPLGIKALCPQTAATTPPIRQDGSSHWVYAGLKDDTHDINRFIPEEVEFYEKSTGTGIKSRYYIKEETGAALGSLQCDGYATIQQGIRRRQFGSQEDLQNIQRIATIIQQDDPPNNHDKELMIHYASQGYVALPLDEGGKPKLQIPFLFAHQWQQYNKLWEQILQDIGPDLFNPLIEGHGQAIAGEIPAFLSPAEQAYLKHSINPHYAILYWLADHGLLRYPTDAEALCVSTIVWGDQS